MALTTLMYVSTSRLDPAAAQTAMDQLMTSSRRWNTQHGLTGALLFTGTHFVQVLEGDAAAIDHLLTKLRADPRHDHIVVTSHGPLQERRFAGWSMAYSGPSLFVQQRVNRVLDEIGRADYPQAQNSLVDIMKEFLQV